MATDKAATTGIQPMKTEIVYIACPYSHRDPGVQVARFHAVNEFAAKLSRDGVIVFSPISHTHPITQYGLPCGWEFWERFDRAYLEICGRMIVLMLSGWKESTGVQAEIKIAAELGMPVSYVAPDPGYTERLRQEN